MILNWDNYCNCCLALVNALVMLTKQQDGGGQLEQWQQTLLQLLQYFLHSNGMDIVEDYMYPRT